MHSSSHNDACRNTSRLKRTTARFSSEFYDDNDSLDIKSMHRRSLIVSAPAIVMGSVGCAKVSLAVETSTSVLDFMTGQGDLPQLETGLLESRVLENVMSPPPYGMERGDVFYPDWFAGTWKVKSVTTDVQAPCGVTLFGGNTTYDKARTEIGTSLDYESRFISDGNGHIVTHCEFNVKSIAKVAMGPNSVVDVSVATPNKFSCLLSPIGAPSMLTVDLIVLNRRQENVDGLYNNSLLGTFLILRVTAS